MLAAALALILQVEESAPALFKGLRSDRIEERVAAEAKLRKLGPAAVIELRKIEEDADPEVAARARRLLGELKLLEEEVLDLLVGQPGVIYVCGRHEYWRLWRMGDEALPWVLHDVKSRQEARKAAFRYLHTYANTRVGLPEGARIWVQSEFGRGETDLFLVGTIGSLGMDDSLPRLQELASGVPERAACVAVQSIAEIGTLAARKALEQLREATPNGVVKEQCRFLLDVLFLPFDDDPDDTKLLDVFLSARTEVLKYSLHGGWFDRRTILARRLVRGRRADLLPRLVELAPTVEKHEREVLRCASPGTSLSALWQAIYLMGGDLPEPVLRWLSEWLIRPSDLPRPRSR